MKTVLGMVLLEGSKKEILELLKHPEILELLELQKDLMDEKKSAQSPMSYYIPSSGNTAGNV